MKARTRDSDAVNKLIEAFTPSINALINSFSYRTSDLKDDCTQSAYICLLNCCNKYDHTKSENFSGFVIISMRNAIINYLRRDAAQTRKISVCKTTYDEFDIIESYRSSYNLEEDALGHIYLEKLKTDMNNGYYSERDVKLFKAICSSDFSIYSYAKANDILITTLYKNIIRLREKIKKRLRSGVAGNGKKFQPHKVVPLSQETLDIKK